jgi:hypothetical protein
LDSDPLRYKNREPFSMTVKHGQQSPPRGLLTEPFTCSSKALHRHRNDLSCLLIPARPDTTINSVVNCRCRRRGTSALYVLNFKDGNLILINLFLRLVSLGFSQRDNNRLLRRLFRSLFSRAFFWFLSHINAGFGFYPRLSSLLRCRPN